MRPRSGRDGDDVKWTSTLSEGDRLDVVVGAAVDAVMRSLDGSRPDLLVAFVSSHFADEYDRVPALVRGAAGGGLLLGCSAGGVIGGGSEVESAPAFSLTAATLPGVDLTPIYVNAQTMPERDDRAGWEALLRCAPDDAPSVVLLPDPFSVPVDRLLQGLDSRFPDSRKVGGLASGAERAGENALFLGDRIHADGLVGVALQGNVRVDSVVAQGCRPIGHPLFVTRVRDHHVLVEVDGRPPVDVIRELFEQADARDRGLLQSALSIGIEMRPDLSEYRRGDFLIRNVAGADPRTGALTIGAPLHEGLVVQFHLRDAQTSAEDLEERLARYQSERGGMGPPHGALLFSWMVRVAIPIMNGSLRARPELNPPVQ